MFHHACYANMGKFECTSPDSYGILNFFIPGFLDYPPFVIPSLNLIFPVCVALQKSSSNLSQESQSLLEKNSTLLEPPFHNQVCKYDLFPYIEDNPWLDNFQPK